MTLSITKRLKRYTGNDAATTFAYDFLIPLITDIEVSIFDSLTSVTTVLSGSQFSITGIGSASFGEVTYPLAGDPLPATSDIIIKRTVPYTQSMDVTNQGGFLPEVLEDQLDAIVMQVQQLAEEAGRTILGPSGDTFDLELPAKANLVDKLLLFDSNGDPIAGPSAANISAAEAHAAAAAASAASAATFGALWADGAGAADVITAAYTPAVTTRPDGLMLGVRATASNATTTPTFNPDTLGADTITKKGGAALAVGDIAGAGHELLLRYDLSNTRWELMNPASAAASVTLPASAAPTPSTAGEMEWDDDDDFLVIGDGSGQVIIGSSRGRRTAFIPAASFTPTITNGAEFGQVELATNDVMLKSLDFDTATRENAQIMLFLPKGYDGGTFFCIFVWSHSTTATNYGVTWGAEMRALADSGAIDQAFGTAVEVTDTGGTTDDLLIAPETAAITAAGAPAGQQFLSLNIYRDPVDAGDNLAIDARFLGLALMYVVNLETDD